MELTACAELPRDVRDALVSWNHSTEYKLPSFQATPGGQGSGMFEKVYDTSERCSLSLASPLATAYCLAWCRVDAFQVKLGAVSVQHRGRQLWEVSC